MKLFEPLDIPGMRIPNRIMVPAMVTHLCGQDGFVTDETIARYVRYARGGTGLIVVEAMAVHQVKSGPLLRISDDAFVPGLRELARRVHDAGDARVVPQIIHFLKVARSGWRQTVDMLAPEDIDRIVDEFGAAAARAREAGFDGAELHSAHAYTLSSFLSRTNPRTDAYGGQTLEGRLHLIRRVMDSVRRRAGADFPIGVRFNGEEFIKNGYTAQESRLIALRLAEMGAAYLSLSAGGKFEDAVHEPGQVLFPYSGYSGDRAMPGDWLPRGLHVHLAAEIKAFLAANGHRTPVAIAGKLSDSGDAERVLVEGKADMVAIARGLLADPDWPDKVRRGERNRIVECDYCNVCKALDGTHRPVICALWPQGELQAPADDSASPPLEWAAGGLEATVENGRVALTWPKATGAGYYDVVRADDLGTTGLVDALKVNHWIDGTVLGGQRYRYHVRARTAGGRAGPPSNTVTVLVPVPGERPGG
jgi:2,4-dienoyl-CoA reductase-like NADH-dependent reductase (Old Yellow Enzyme family)